MVTNAAGDPFEALGDPNRRDILRLLSEGDKPVSQIAAALPISRPAVSRHLRLLKEAGLVAEQARGTSRIYHLRGEGLRAVQEYLEQVWGDAAAALPADGREHPETHARERRMTAPLRMSFDVACSAGHAFTVWTSGIGTWWPPDHTMTGRAEAVVLQGGVGGRIYERTADGTEHEWGEVIVWQPPARLAYLWYLGRDRADATEVEIRFLAQGDRRHPGGDRAPRLGAAEPADRRVVARPQPGQLADLATAFHQGNH